MYSKERSSVISMGTCRAVSTSAPAERMLVSFLALQTFTSRSCGRLCSPITMPEYTLVPGLMKNEPRSSKLWMA
ncbi:hypothetical protein D3C72_2281430 [compost metagenome]